jgi:hypothetical protein
MKFDDYQETRSSFVFYYSYQSIAVYITVATDILISKTYSNTM